MISEIKWNLELSKNDKNPQLQRNSRQFLLMVRGQIYNHEGSYKRSYLINDIEKWWTCITRHDYLHTKMLHNHIIMTMIVGRA